MTLTVGSCFSGIGGIDLGLERAGMTVIWQSEIDPYCCRVLAKHWPHVPNLGDVTTIDWSRVERPDVICGGYPCQPFSLAGTRAGTGDPRHLWPHMAAALRVLRPRWALLENVPGHLSLGFDRVLADLAEIGFDAEWGIVSAAAVGAPHLRERLIVVAYPNSTLGRPAGDAKPGDGASAVLRRGTPEPRGRRGDVADTDGGRREVVEERHGRTPARQPAPLGDDVDGHRVERAEWWAVEPDVGRVAHGIPHRVDRLRALGNAVVPQVAEHIGHQILLAALVSA